MNLENYYYYFQSALPARLCDDIIKYALKKEETVGTTGEFDKIEKLNEEQIKRLKQTRHSDIVWLNDLWIYRELQPYIHEANRAAGWNFDWDRSETCQFTKYKLNQYYDWHCDSWGKPYDRPGENDHGKIRKLSMTCQLTDGSEYEGGELEFDFRASKPNEKDRLKDIVQVKEILPKGSIVVFPSHLWHRVKPVTKGTRYSLVMWNLGYPFK
jgi:PKHD-type hydroxylase